MIRSEDICYWDEHTWCYGHELEEMLSFMSDDFQVIKEDSKEYLEFLREQLTELTCKMEDIPCNPKSITENTTS